MNGGLNKECPPSTPNMGSRWWCCFGKIKESVGSTALLEEACGVLGVVSKGPLPAPLSASQVSLKVLALCFPLQLPLAILTP